MELLPRGAKMLWEFGLHIAGNPMARYGNNRDMCIADIAQIVTESESTPMDVPLHPGAQAWLQEHQSSRDRL